MLHAKFQGHKTSGSGEKDFYNMGGHLGHVTWTIYINFCSRLQMKFGIDWPRGYREDV